MVTLQAVQPLPLLGALQARREPLGEVEEDAGVRRPRAVGVAGRPPGAPRRTRGSSRAWRSAARRLLLEAADQALVDEGGQAVEDVDRARSPRPGPPTASAASRSHPPRKTDRRASSFRWGSSRRSQLQAIAPRSVRWRSGRSRAVEVSRPSCPSEPCQDLLGREELHPRRGQLDRERHPVEPGADAGDGRRVLVRHPEVRANRHGAGDEEPDSLVLVQRRRIRVAQGGGQVLELDPREPARVGRRR